MSIPIGSVIEFKNETGIYVITGMKNYEDFGSCSYSRDYYVTTLANIEKKDYIGENEGRLIKVRGTILPFTIVENAAPFRIVKEVRYKVERMVEKTVVVYE